MTCRLALRVSHLNCKSTSMTICSPWLTSLLREVSVLPPLGERLLIRVYQVFY